MSETIIELKKVTKEYYIFRKNIQRILGILFDRRPSEVKIAIDNLSLKIGKGERVLILGANGSGCTTLQKIISGVTYPTKGKVNVSGTINSFLNRKVGYDYELPTLDNIYMKANAIGLSKDVVTENLNKICDFAELEEKHMKMPIKNAPTGCVVRIAIYLHVLKDSDVFIIDEKMGLGGDASRKKCEGLIRKYLEDNEEVTFLTTNVNGGFVKSVCNRGIILQEGKIIYDGSITETFEVWKEVKKKAASQTA